MFIYMYIYIYIYYVFEPGLMFDKRERFVAHVQLTDPFYVRVRFNSIQFDSIRFNSIQFDSHIKYLKIRVYMYLCMYASMYAYICIRI